ncbi:hypothetical protein [Porphyromonas gulae]|uniref:hypothetical protein n=1 Tax=Porphyromonas gulae TaxID=111105 RepID=UPI00052BAE4B|nr:hypothetical protein [Porphyromonas gulae]KGN89305.1 molecular chaperone DnaJ [Porphyromonas gulae]KKC50793.1 molecular chaperone DnaJ [Porphyromonas gulae]
MNEKLIQDSIKVAEKVITKTAELGSEPINWWMWLAIVEFGVIAFVLLNRKFKKAETAKQHFKRENKKTNIDFDNIINSSFNSRNLYDELKIKCHPDRFTTDKEKNNIAEILFQEITENKNNVRRLLELKQEALDKLKIKI